VIESGGTPTIGVVTGSALCAKTAGMCIIINMAGRTIHGRAFENIILMAVCAGGCRVFAIEFEGKLGVVYMGGFPAIGRMATFTLSAKSAAMRIVINMTGGAVHRSAFEDAVLMTVFASHGCMLTIEMKCKFGVIYMGGFPAIGRMTGRAILSKLAVVEIILLMTGIALLRRGLHVGDGSVIEMTLGAGSQSVLPNQIERNPVMVKV